MASLLGTNVRLGCPACGEPVSVPVRQLDADRATVTVALDLAQFRAHIDTAHNRSQPSDG